MIESVASPVCQRGGESQLRLQGEGFTGCKSIIFYTPKIRCVSFEVESDYEMTAVVQADEDCLISNQPFRLLSEFGFSDMRTLRVTPFPVLPEESAGTTRVPPTGGLTFSGVLESGDIDRYQIELVAGQRLSVEVEAIRLGYEMLDTVLKVYDPSGERIARVDDDPLFQQDPVATLVARTSGTYVIEINESNYQGSSNGNYLLHVGTFPRPSVVFPAGGHFGQNLRFELIASDGSRERQTTELPSKDESSGFEFRPAASLGASVPTPLPFRLTELVGTLESEPNDSPEETSTVVIFPAAFDGIISEPGDVDWFRLKIPATLISGEKICIEVFADRIGSPIDTMLQVFEANGGQVVSNDDWGSHDSRVEFRPAAGLDYYVRVSDKLSGGKPNGVYRVEVRSVEPRVSAFLPRPNRNTQEEQVISIPQGNRVMKRVAVRREHVDGDVILQIEDLPSGVSASLQEIPQDRFWIPIVLRAEHSARVGGQLAKLSAAIGGTAIAGDFSQTVDLVHSTADQTFNSATVDRLAVAVTPSVPFAVDVLTPSVGLPIGGTLQLKVRVKRQSGFDEPVRVTLPFLPPWVTSQDRLVIPKGEQEGVFQLEASPRASRRLWNLVALAEVDSLSALGEVAQLDGRTVASELTRLEIVENAISGRLTNLAGSPGERIKVLCELRGDRDNRGSFVATLEGLPAKVSAPQVEVSSGEGTIEFAVEVGDDVASGLYGPLQCRLSGFLEGQRVSYVVAKGTRLIIEEPGKLLRNADGRLLSPLEALREKKTGRRDDSSDL